MLLGDPARCHPCVGIKEEVARVLLHNVVEVLRPIAQAGTAVFDELRTVNAEQAGEERKVFLLPTFQVARHRVNGEIVQNVTPLKRAEQTAFPMVEGVTKKIEIHPLVPHEI